MTGCGADASLARTASGESGGEGGVARTASAPRTASEVRPTNLARTVSAARTVTGEARAGRLATHEITD
jgi:hypothetical protein